MVGNQGSCRFCLRDSKNASKSDRAILKIFLPLRKGYKGEADYFGVYSPEMGKVYLVPVDDVPIGSKGLLRLHATRNNQQKGVKWAKDYEI